MLPDCMYEYRYSHKTTEPTLTCYCCNDNIDEGDYYFDIDGTSYCISCINHSRKIVGID